LLICGEIGSGKTILCSSTIEEVNRTRNKSEIIVRYYFDSKKPDKRNLLGLLASLVTQLCESCKRHPKSCPRYTRNTAMARLIDWYGTIFQDILKDLL